MFCVVLNTSMFFKCCCNILIYAFTWTSIRGKKDLDKWSSLKSFKMNKNKTEGQDFNLFQVRPKFSIWLFHFPINWSPKNVINRYPGMTDRFRLIIDGIRTIEKEFLASVGTPIKDRKIVTILILDELRTRTPVVDQCSESFSRDERKIMKKYINLLRCWHKTIHLRTVY